MTYAGAQEAEDDYDSEGSIVGGIFFKGKETKNDWVYKEWDHNKGTGDAEWKAFFD